MKKFVVLDGSSLVYRAFFALPLLTNKSGEYTNAVFGFANMFFKLWEELSPVDGLVIAFDKSRHTFRTDIYDRYKGTRAKTPPELSAQLPKIREFAECMGVKFIELDGYEADDIIGTLGVAAADAGFDAYAVTGDRDALQLIRKNLRILYTQKGVQNIKCYDEAAFAADYGGLKPVRLIDLKALMGDKSDNIPGIFGIGEKTAVKLIQEYGSVENVLENAANVKGASLQKKLAEGKEAAMLSKKLATIKCDVPDLPFIPAEYAVSPNRDKMNEFCEKNELRNVWKNFERVFPGEDAEELLALSDDDAPVAFHAEYVCGVEELNAISGKFALATVCDNGFIKGLAITDGSRTVLVEGENVWRETQDFLAGKEFFAHDTKRLYHSGLTDSVAPFDVELAAYLLRPEDKSYDLATLSNEFLNEQIPVSFESPVDEACFVANVTLKLGKVLREKLAENGMSELMRDVEQPLSAILANMEKVGVFVNRDALADKAAVAQQHIDALEREIYEAAGEEFNINSPKQLSAVLFERLGLKGAKKNKSGTYSTNAEVLGELRDAHPVVGKILDYRLWMKLKSTYLDGIGELIDTKTGRVHTSFNQTVTATGRLSSSDPNLQNIPVRSREGREIRACFEPGDGFDVIVSADYSQIELRVLAAMAHDENLLKAFRSGMDIHAHTAAEVFGVSPEEVTPLLRRRAKAINFGIVYGLSDYGLAKDLAVSRKEAAGYIDGYFKRYAAVKKFLDETIDFARREGYVKTMFGRRRYLPNINGKNYNLRGMAERMAMNTPIQGTAADIIKLAMIAADKKIRAANLKSRIILQVHDELVVEATCGEKERLKEILRETMENVVALDVPLVVNLAEGKNWAEAK